jgi:ribosomal protein L12E/L44/L45/RPP1/RPP2
MSDNQATFQGNDPAAHAPDAAAYDKGKGKAVEEMDVSMDEEEEEESEESDVEIVCAPDPLFQARPLMCFSPLL